LTAFEHEQAVADSVARERCREFVGALGEMAQPSKCSGITSRSTSDQGSMPATLSPSSSAALMVDKTRLAEGRNAFPAHSPQRSLRSRQPYDIRLTPELKREAGAVRGEG
jgi:hypothetical protein